MTSSHHGRAWNLSVGQRPVFSGVVADKAMSAMGGAEAGVRNTSSSEPWWPSALGGLGWGLVNGFSSAGRRLPPYRHVCTLGRRPRAWEEVITGGVDMRNYPDRNGQKLIGFGQTSYGRLNALGVTSRPVVVRDRHRVTDRTRSGCTVSRSDQTPRPGRRSGLQRPRTAVRDLSWSGLTGRIRRLAQSGVLPVDHERRPEHEQHQSSSPALYRQATSRRRLRVHLRASSACSSRPLQDGFVIIGIQPFCSRWLWGAISTHRRGRHRPAAARSRLRWRRAEAERLMNHLIHQQTDDASTALPTPGRTQRPPRPSDQPLSRLEPAA